MTIFPIFKQWMRFSAFTGFCALSMGISLGFSGITGQETITNPLYLSLIKLAILLFVGVALIFSSPLIRCLSFLIAGVFISYLSSYDQNAVFGQWRRQVLPNQKCHLHGEIVSLPTMAKGKYSFIVTVDSLIAEGCQGSFYNKNVVCFTTQCPRAIGHAEMTGRFAIPRPREDSCSGFDEYAYYLSNDLWGNFYADSLIIIESFHSFLWQWASSVRSLVKTSLAHIHNEEYRGILIASFLNDKNDLSESMKTLFYQAGIYHLLALSGFNIAILAGVIYAILFIFPIRKEIKVLIALAIVWLYLFFIGFIPSLFRAVIMTTAIGISFLFQKKNYPLNSLGIAGIVWLILSPMSLFTPGFQLSFGATFGLITLAPMMIDYLKFPSFHGIARIILQSFLCIAAVSIASFIVTLPILIYHFHQLYLFGLFANLFSVTLMSIAMWLACIGFLCQIIFPPFVTICMRGAEFFVFIMIKGASLVQFAPWSTIGFSMPYPEPYFFFALFIIGVIVIKKELRFRYLMIATPISLVLSLLCINAHITKHTMEITFLKMRKSQIAVVKLPNNRAWLFDIGSEAPPATAYSQYILPWKDRFFGIRVEKIFLPRWKRDEVHFLKPLLENENAAEIISCDSIFERNNDFSSFVISSFQRKIIHKNPGDSLGIWKKGFCKIISRNDKNCRGTLAFILRADKRTIFIPEFKFGGREFAADQVSLLPRHTTSSWE